MTTRTIRETDITITSIYRRRAYAPAARYELTEKALGQFVGETVDRVVGRYENFAAALQARADIIDERAGAARVGDIVRIGLKGKVHYEVRSVLPWGELGLRPVGESDRLAVRYVTVERAHVVEAHR